MDIRIEIDEKAIRELIGKFLQSQLGELPVSMRDVVIEVKSRQNYRSEWEPAAFRAVYTKRTP